MRKTSSWLISLCSFLVFYASTVSLAITATADKPANWPQIKYEKYKLQNGLEVILSEDHRLPLVAVNLWYHVGPMYEKPGRTGIRAPVRAHDVPGLEERRREGAFQVS